METLIGSVPDGWRELPLGECCELSPGPSGTVLRSADYVVGGVPLVTAKDIGDRRINPPAHSVDQAAAVSLGRFAVEPGDLLLVRLGTTARHAVVEPEQAGWLMGGSCIRARIRQGIDLGALYLSAYLTHPAVADWLAHSVRRGVIPTISAGTLADLPVVLAPTDIQRDIADTMSVLDHKISVHEQIAATTRTLRELLLPQLLAGGPMDI